MTVDTEDGRGSRSSRPLTTLEHQVISAILCADCPGVLELRAQLSTARVRGNWTPKGSPSIDLEVSSVAPAAPLSGPTLPVDVHVYDDQGRFLGELIVWLSNGKLSALEYAWVTDSAPLSLPNVEMLRVLPR